MNKIATFFFSINNLSFKITEVVVVVVENNKMTTSAATSAHEIPFGVFFLFIYHSATS